MRGVVQAIDCALVVAFLFLLPVVAARSQQIELGVANAEVSQNFDGKTAITVTFDSESSRAFANFTSALVGRMVEIRLGDKVLTKSRIQTPITKGRFMFLSGDDTGELIQQLSHGARLGVRRVDESNSK
jgi:preprotein translocase subunit SecD